MRCAIFVGLLAAVIALCEAKSLSSVRLSSLRALILASRQQQVETNTEAEVEPEVRKMPDPTLEATMFAARCMLELSTWTDPPAEVWETDNFMQYHEEPWFPCLATIGAIMVYANETTPDDVKDMLDHVFLQHVEELKCMLLSERRNKLMKAVEDGTVPVEEVKLVIGLDEVVTCHCETREKEKEELDKMFEEMQDAEGTQDGPAQTGQGQEQGAANGSGQVAGTGQGTRADATFMLHGDLQRQLSRLLASPAGTRALSQLLLRRGGDRKDGNKGDKAGKPDEEDDSQSSEEQTESGKSSKSSSCADTKCDAEPPLKPTTLDAILFAADCTLDPMVYENDPELCEEVYYVLNLYTDGDVSVEEYIQDRTRQIKCEEWTVLSEDIHTIMGEDSVLGSILSDPTFVGLWELVENEVGVGCQVPNKRDLLMRELKKMLANQMRKK